MGQSASSAYIRFIRSSQEDKDSFMREISIIEWVLLHRKNWHSASGGRWREYRAEGLFEMMDSLTWQWLGECVKEA